MFLKTNINYEYDPFDQNGQIVTGNKKLLLVLRSNVPQGFAQYPTVAAYVKLDYKDQ